MSPAIVPAPSPHLLRSLRSTILPSTMVLPRLSPRKPPHLRHAPAPLQRYRWLSTTSHFFGPATNLPSDRGPKSTEDTVTNFNEMNVLSATPAPTSSIDACLSDGFHFSSGLKILGGSGCLLVGGEAFVWRPWDRRRLLNAKGQWDVKAQAWGILELVWPKPGTPLSKQTAEEILLDPTQHADATALDLLILGLGPSMRPLSPETRRYINSLGIRVDIQDTRNAASQFNLLATERGVGNIAAALIPIGWREPT